MTSNPALGYLEFLSRWEDKEEMDAYEVSVRLRNAAPTYAELRELASDGSEDWRMFLRSFASFEDAARLIRQGAMREDLFFEGWWGLPRAWDLVEPYVRGLREEKKNPNLYEGFEWVAQRAVEYRAQLQKSPPKICPLEHDPPTDADNEVFSAFRKIWTSPEAADAMVFFQELESRSTGCEELVDLLKPGSKEYVLWDGVCCLYDQAGTLIKYGALHPKLFADNWRSAIEIWEFAKGWVLATREKKNSSVLYENLEWLAEYQSSFPQPTA